MNYAFKMMAVVLALGVLVLQGCQKHTTGLLRGSHQNISNVVKVLSDKKLCIMAIKKTSYGNKWDINNFNLHVDEAKRRGLDCGVNEKVRALIASNSNTNNYSPLINYSNDLIISNACSFNGFKYTNYKSDIVSKQYVREAKRRGLDCGVGNSNKTVIASKPKTYTQSKSLISSSDKFGRYDSQGDEIANLDKKSLMQNACDNGNWIDSNYRHVSEAQKRGLKCGINGIASEFSVSELSKNYNLSKSDDIKIGNYSDYVICLRTKWREGYLPYQGEAIRRGLDCGVKDKKTITASKKNQKNNIDITAATCALMPSMLSCRFFRKSGIELCESINGYKRGVETYDNYAGSLKEANRRGLNCGVISKNKTITASKPKTQIYTKPITSSAELDAERKKRIELERKLAAMEAKQKQEQQRIDTDTRVPLIEIISNETKGKRGTIYGIARDNVEVAEVTINGKQVSLSNNGNFKYSIFVPSDGLTLNVQVTDVAGLTSSKTVSLQRNETVASTAISFDRLNPLGKRVKANSNALALIVGVEGYKNTNADALYADSDAKMFRDYASEKLGISEGRIKTLLNDNATEQEILLSVKEWLRRSAKPNKSDIYVFFAGHGLASQDGKNMYLLPHDGSPRLLDDTAILRDRLFADLKATNPKSVTVFLDTCYSGVTRNEEMLIAGRPIVIKAKEQAIPDGFTLFSAASNEQISRPLEEAKHGMFSYFLMKGMEGDADANNDNRITARELHAYVEQNVVQQSSGSQTPELQGDKDRVLVQFN
ncbi:MAG: caspase domain-containing protein [Candidatus Puniceispirillales bacterium]